MSDIRPVVPSPVSVRQLGLAEDSQPVVVTVAVRSIIFELGYPAGEMLE